MNYAAMTEKTPRIARSVTEETNAAPSSDVTLRTFRLSPDEMPEVPQGLEVGDTLEVELFGDIDFRLAVAERTPSKVAAYRTFLASAEGYEGICNAVIVETPEGLQIDVQDYRNGRAYSVFSTAEGVVVREMDPSKDQGVHLPSLEIPASEDGGVKISATASSAQNPYVDILVAYDTEAAKWVVANGGGVRGFAEVAVQKMNAALSNSGIWSSRFTFRLVGTYEVGASANGDLEGALKAVQSGSRSWNGGDWSGVRKERDAVGADIVVTLVDAGATGTVGLGYSLQSGNSAFVGYAYNCCSIQSVAVSHTMTHEVGHNMGAGHADQQKDDPGPQFHPYSSGYYFEVNDVNYCTIMAYTSDGYTKTYHRQVPYFSSPDRNYYGVAVGDATHNNALTLKENYNIVSRFRTAKDASPEPGGGEEEQTSAGRFFGLQWTTGRNFPWEYRLYYDVYAARSGDFRNGTETPSTGVSWLETTIEGPRTVSFSYDTYFGSGPFLVSVDGGVALSITGGSGWESFLVPAGSHRVRFAFECYDWYCGPNVFNGIWLYDLRISDNALVPIIEPASTTDPETALRFEDELIISITNSYPGSTIYYTTSPHGEAEKTAAVYRGPFRIRKSTVVRAFAQAQDGTKTGPTERCFIERHPVQPGEWTADVEGVLGAAKTNGNLIVAIGTYSSDETASRFGDLVAAAETPAFCEWAHANKVYLLACDIAVTEDGSYQDWGRYAEYRSAARYFNVLSSSGFQSSTRLVVARAWAPSKRIGEMVGRSGNYLGGSQYRGTTSSLIACLENLLSPRPAKSVTVTFDAKDGTVSPKTLTRTCGQPFGALPVPVRRNYAFRGWNFKQPRDSDSYQYDVYFGKASVLPEDIVPYEDVTLEAQWEYNGVYVYFMRQYSPEGPYYYHDANYYQRGSAYGSLPKTDPTMSGYAFRGWYDRKVGGTRLTATSLVPDQSEAVTNYAQWTANTYAVRFNANGSSVYPTAGKMEPQGFLYDQAKALHANEYVREGFVFQGWALSATSSDVSYKDAAVVSNLTAQAGQSVDLYAVWKGGTVNVTFDMNGFPDFQNEKKSYTVGTSVASWMLPYVGSTRYVVDGWYTARAGGTKIADPFMVPSRDTTYYLRWHKKAYTVVFNANGGTGTMSTQPFFYGESQRLAANAFQKNGFIFAGWATSATGKACYVDRQRVSDLVTTEGGRLTLYATWEARVEPGPTPLPNGYDYRQTVGNHTWSFEVWNGKSYIYRVDEDGYCQCAVTPMPSGEIEVPATLGGHPVAQVGACAFWLCTEMERVVLPSTLEMLGTYAFYGCTSLTEVVFRGDAPSVASETSVFAYSPNAEVLVSVKSKGWNVPIPGIWLGLPINYWDKSYRMTFGKNGGTGGDNYVTVAYGAKPHDVTVPKKANSTFCGYWTSVQPGGKMYIGADGRAVCVWDKTADATLWAKWSNKITFGKNAGTGGDDYVTAYQNVKPHDVTVPKRAGYWFAGYWTTTGAGGVMYYDPDGKASRVWDKTSDVTLWAKWLKVVSCRVTFGKNGGTGGDGWVTVSTGTKPHDVTVPKRAGYVFGGYWTTTGAGGVQYFNAAGKATCVWDKGVDATLWAMWTKTSAAVVTVPVSQVSAASCPAAVPADFFAPGYHHGVFAGDEGVFDLLLDEDGTAHLSAETESDGFWTATGEAEVVGETLVIMLEDGLLRIVAQDGGLVAQMP